MSTALLDVARRRPRPQDLPRLRRQAVVDLHHEAVIATTQKVVQLEGLPFASRSKPWLTPEPSPQSLIFGPETIETQKVERLTAKQKTAKKLMLDVDEVGVVLPLLEVGGFKGKCRQLPARALRALSFQETQAFPHGAHADNVCGAENLHVGM